MTRPSCEVPGCDNLAQPITGGNNPRYRKTKWVREEHNASNGWVCSRCHGKKIAKKHGVKDIATVIANNAGFSTSTEYQKDQAIKAGFRSLTEMTNARHPYRKYRKDYCENNDGRLGFVCTTVFPHEDELNALGIEYGAAPHFDVDHIDGNPRNNDPKNLQTLCKCCHSIKGLINQDYKSAGRKTLGC